MVPVLDYVAELEELEELERTYLQCLVGSALQQIRALICDMEFYLDYVGKH